jgi:membrane-associated phospholipid phosphatase
VFLRAIAAGGAGLTFVDGPRHAFNLNDPSISYPYLADTVSVSVVAIVCLIVPGVVMALVSLILVPGPTASRATPALIWRRKIWEWNTAWMGLALSLASSFFLTEALKDIAGKPRPHMLDICKPDLSEESIARWRVGGVGTHLDSNSPILVTWEICTSTETGKMRNAFVSWPSGHASFAWAGLLYFSLFICAKFAVTIPFLPVAAQASSRTYISTFDEDEPYRGFQLVNQRDKPHTSSTFNSNNNQNEQTIPPRNIAAAPPIWLLILAFIPVGGALFISVSRWFDYRHFGIDIFSGSVLGIVTAWFSFRWYHMPIRTGSGWAWGARSRERAFWLGIGQPSYVGDEGWESGKLAHQRTTFDLERNERGDMGGNDRYAYTEGEAASDNTLTGPGRRDHAMETEMSSIGARRHQGQGSQFPGTSTPMSSSAHQGQKYESAHDQLDLSQGEGRGQMQQLQQQEMGPAVPSKDRDRTSPGVF